jgi:hypothetical protein
MSRVRRREGRVWMYCVYCVVKGLLATQAGRAGAGEVVGEGLYGDTGIVRSQIRLEVAT